MSGNSRRSGRSGRSGWGNHVTRQQLGLSVLSLGRLLAAKYFSGHHDNPSRSLGWHNGNISVARGRRERVGGAGGGWRRPCPWQQSGGPGWPQDGCAWSWRAPLGVKTAVLARMDSAMLALRDARRARPGHWIRGGGRSRSGADRIG